jgi:hypothetical protein
MEKRAPSEKSPPIYASANITMKARLCLGRGVGRGLAGGWARAGGGGLPHLGITYRVCACNREPRESTRD